jgi:hypothetical protein
MIASCRRHCRRVIVRAVLLPAIAAIVWATASPASAQLGLNRLIISVTAPSSGATVSGTTTISASVEIVGVLTVVGVQFMVDGVSVGAEDTTAPYSIPWNTRTTSNGPHTVVAVARDLLGARWWSDPVSITVFNDLTPPAVTVTAPAAGAVVSGTTTVRAVASDNVGVTGVQFRLDGANVGAEDTTAPYEIPWNTAAASSGAHTWTAVARDAAGNTTTSGGVSVTVDNAPPSVGITAPSAGAIVSGTVTVKANASDNIAVVSVQFRLDGADFGAADTAAPYEIPWNTAAASSGPHTLTAVARDVAGLTTTSATVSVITDNASPSVSITAPAAGATVSGVVTVSAGASDDVGVAGIQFFVDGAAHGAEDTSAPFSTAWDTSTAAAGSHTLTARARDTAGNSTTSATVTVTVAGVDSVAPSVSITAPTAGATVSGIVLVSASASDNVGVVGVQFFLDGAAHGAEDTSAPYSTTWDTGTAAPGSHTWTARARDAAGNSTTSATVTVTVENVDTVAPSVSITAPATGATVSGIVTLNADAADNVAVAGVQFFVDGTALGGEDTSAPYSTTWDTATAAAGSHALTARARDTAGNSRTSSAVMVTVAGAGGTTLRIEDGDSAVSYSGGWNTGNTAKAWSGGTAAVGFAEGHNAFVDFRGTGVRWISFRAPYAGIANVYVDGTLAGTVDLYAPQEAVGLAAFTASGLTLGAHTLRIEVTRTKNAASGDYLITIDAFDIIDPVPDTQAPTITITEPAGGEIVFGTLPITASASDDVGVAGVTFFVDGTPLGSADTVSPYTVNWTTTSVPDGDHTLSAVARDAAGNTRTSAPVTVTVSNAAPPATATATRIENTDPAITYVDGCTTCGQVPSWFHGSRSRPWSNGTASFNRADGGRASLTFSGSAVSWISFRASWAGIARVFVDGAFVREIDLYAPTEEAKVSVFEVTNLAPGSHTIAVEATGRKNPDAGDFAVVVDAFDVSPAAPPKVDGTRMEETAASATFTPGWTQGDATRAWSGGAAAVSDTTGARATFVFSGTAVDWVAVRSPQMGIARVYLDGAVQAEVDLYAARSHQGTVFTATALLPGQHRLEIEVTGVRNASAMGHTIAVDAFDVRSRVEDNDAAITYSGAWGLNDSDRNWSGTSMAMGSGTAARSATAGDSALLTFTGTAVSWIGVRAPWVGIADVFLDGAFAQQIDMYAPAEQLQVPLFTASGLAAGTHTLRVAVTGQKNAASSTARVMIDAFDITVPTPAPPVTRVQETDAAVAYTPGWAASGISDLWSGRNARQAVAVGERATFTFTGTSVRWLGERGFTTGVARVSLDGQLIGQIDTRAPFQEEYQSPLLTLKGLTPGSHTLTIEVVGRNAEAAGTAVDRIVIDGFDIQ